MARYIAILPDAVADQIAAGEVVERPASVVKELVENALDAEARHVRVMIENGGKVLIEVADDGTGMSREDAVLSLDRLATSKVRSAADLVGVRTYGFRGEALPAIASVSRFRLTTADGQEEGSELTVSGGKLERVSTVARQTGTTVTVHSLFFNTPARRKFLRSAASETRAVHEAIATLALAHPETGFELNADGSPRLSVPADQEPPERLASVWGRELVGTLVPVQYAAGAFRVSGYVQRPGDAQPSGRRTQLFVNGRPFRDPFLIRAAEAGYRAAIHPGDRPSVYLRIDVAAEDVDVNVHPAKLEVRFRDRIGVERVVEEAVRSALGALVAAIPVGDWRALPTAPEFGSSAPELTESGQLFAADSPDAEERRDVSEGGFQAPLLQVFDSYIIYQGPDGIIIVDQHSAHE